MEISPHQNLDHVQFSFLRGRMKRSRILVVVGISSGIPFSQQNLWKKKQLYGNKDAKRSQMYVRNLFFRLSLTGVKKVTDLSGFSKLAVRKLLFQE